MNCAVRIPQPADCVSMVRHCNAPPGRHGSARSPGHLRLAQLSAISGVDLQTIDNWTDRGVWHRPADGRHRRFTFWDCLHIAIIREMASLGMHLSGHGAMLSDSLMECARLHVSWTKDTSCVPKRVALFALDDEAEWSMDWLTDDPGLPRSYVVLNLKAITEEVAQRYREHCTPI
ncbi:MerR family transcriptional regulator [Methylobacterium gnaphalii]|uniref:HTH merR-type domain-containing protein n=1 Tax=Methylobacterium gnaphalii TaxID=1010610 RepID=A0A512JHD6_9HYPH|nr:MerR family transcriptional regulator [Methylobacterium gnaphalii]GEP09282.1 hypothetical protein MGN01_11270 [Methylobacterium gnaphalii]GJD69063.1 hypothetical protein MMMDOFMJ_1989 [Methylobacterium gnaphalii]GLS50985.1 hypothetical protein GCM10007885_38390 [Methylobacterium gnaphalii]